MSKDVFGPGMDSAAQDINGDNEHFKKEGKTNKKFVKQSLIDIVEGERKDFGKPTDRMIITDDSGNKYLRLKKFDSVENLARKIIMEDV